MFSVPSPPVCRKRKPNANTPLGSRKRIRLVGSFEPRCIVPTGARRSWTFAKEPRFVFGTVTHGSKRSLVEYEDMSSNCNCKARVLDNRDVLFLPSCKRLSPPGKPQRKRTPSSSPAKKSVEFVRLRRREFLRQRQLQRVDSGICMESDEDLNLDTLFEPMTTGEDFKLFDGVSASTFTGFSVEMMEATEAATEDDMEIEDASISTTTTSTSATEGDVADPDSATEQTTSSKDEVKGEELEEGMPVDREEEEEEKESSDVEVGDAEKKISEQKEANTKLSTKDTVVKERIRKRLGADELVRLGPSNSKKGVTKTVDEDEEEDEEPPRRSTRRKSTKPSLPTTVEEEDEKEHEDDDDDVVVVKRKASRNSRNKEDTKDDGSDEEVERQEEKKERKKLARRKAKVEESESEADESEREEVKKPKRKVVKQEEKIDDDDDEELVGDKMEEDTDEDANSSGEDTDMSTDEDITEAAAENKAAIEKLALEEEDVTMSEDDEMTEESLAKETEVDIDAETPAEDTQDVKDVEAAGEEVELDQEKLEKLETTTVTVSVEAKKSVRRLVLAPSRKDELEVAKLLSTPRTPRTPRSPNMSRFNITMSKAPRKLNPLSNPLMSPRRGKFNRSEDLSAHWAMKRLAAKKRQQPFNPANISRHAYRDPINEDELYNHAARRALLEDDEAEEAYADEHCQRVGWTCAAKSWDGRYSSWMVENGSALMEFCVRQLEGFNMGW